MRHSSSHCSSTISAPTQMSATVSPQSRSRRLRGARGGTALSAIGVDSKAFGVLCASASPPDGVGGLSSASALAPSGLAPSASACAAGVESPAAGVAGVKAGEVPRGFASPAPAFSSSRRSASPLSSPCATRRWSEASAARITFGDLLSMARRSGTRISST